MMGDDEEEERGGGERGVFTCLHVAEKPSLAKSIAQLLSSSSEEKKLDDDDCDESSLGNKRGLKTKKTTVGSIEMHEFYRPFLRKKCLHRFTSVAGHVCSIDFPDKFQDWDLDPKLLFDCKTEKKVTAGRIRGSLEREARTCDALVLWLDCDREGENICFEVMDAVVPRMRGGGGRYENVYRQSLARYRNRA